jgi:hypothetical protein
MARFVRWTIVLIVVVGVAAVMARVWAGRPQAADYSAPLRAAVSHLTVAHENGVGYDRSLFEHWVDADHDGCDTRKEVLIAEAETRPDVSTACALSGGRWYSYYDGQYWTRTSDVDIDHVVALAEAWASGAREWSADRRRSYANDLGDDRALAAVTDNVNQSKSDGDPAEWLPPQEAARCRYIGDWVAVKIRWALSVDRAEKDALTSLADRCPDATISVQLA